MLRYNFRPEVDSDVIYSVAVDCVGMDVHVKFDDSRSNSSRDIRGAYFFSTSEHDRSLSHKAEKPNNPIHSGEMSLLTPVSKTFK